MNSDDDVTWGAEEEEEWLHDEWLRIEAMGGEAYTKVWEEQEAKKRSKEEEREEEEEMEEDPYEKEERQRWKREEEEAREAYLKKIKEEENEEEEEESQFVDLPTLRPSDSSTDIDISSQETNLDNPQAVVESPRAEGDESPRAEGAESPRAEGAEPAEARDSGPQEKDGGLEMGNTGQMTEYYLYGLYVVLCPWPLQPRLPRLPRLPDSRPLPADYPN